MLQILGRLRFRTIVANDGKIFCRRCENWSMRCIMNNEWFIIRMWFCRRERASTHTRSTRCCCCAHFGSSISVLHDVSIIGSSVIYNYGRKSRQTAKIIACKISAAFVLTYSGRIIISHYISTRCSIWIIWFVVGVVCCRCLLLHIFVRWTEICVCVCEWVSGWVLGV